METVISSLLFLNFLRCRFHGGSQGKKLSVQTHDNKQ